MEYVTLNNGIKMPVLGYGVYQVTKDECKRCVLDALETGYRLIDTAQSYFNEEDVGEAIAESGVARNDIFLTTKVWVEHYGYEETKKSVYTSLKKLKTEYLDLMLLHQPFADYYGAYRALEDLYTEGVIRAIGVSNFYDVQIEAWAPFGEGRGGLFENPVLAEIGKQYNKTPAQVMLRWNIQRGVIVLPKSTHKERIEQNFDVFDFILSESDMQKIAELDTQTSSFFSHYDPAMVEWFAQMVEERKTKHDSSKEKKSW